MGPHITHNENCRGRYLRRLVLAIAIISMLIDHSARGILYHLLQSPDNGLSPEHYEQLKSIYDIMRIVGRTAFPLFCYMLVEGFVHTRSRLRYFLRLLLLAVLSEIPQDLVFYHSICYISKQNVVWELLTGLVALSLIELIIDHSDTRINSVNFPISLTEQVYNNTDQEKTSFIPPPLSLALITSVIALCSLIATWAKFDYSWKGICIISALYLFRHFPVLAALGGYIPAYLSSQWTFPAFLIIMIVKTISRPDITGQTIEPNIDNILTNVRLAATGQGQWITPSPQSVLDKSLPVRYMHYIIYPLHLLLFYCITLCLI